MRIWQVFDILPRLHLLMMSLDCHLVIRHKKGDNLYMLIGGVFVFLLIGGDLDCI